MSRRAAPAADSAAAAGSGDTKQRILDAAERLFSDQGVGATSIRAITVEAGVNVAAVHYHFGGRDEMLRAVLQRRLGAVNRERLRRLDALEAGTAPLTVEAVVEALLSPAVLGAVEDASLPRMADLLLAEPASRARDLAVEIFGEVSERFCNCFESLLPALTPEVVRERFMFSVGAMIHAIHGPDLLSGAASKASPRARASHTLAQLTQFVSAGLRAPVRDQGDPS